MDQYINIFQNLKPSLLQIQKLITAIAYVMGVHFLIKGVGALKHAGEMRSHMSQQHSMKEPIFYLLSGSMLIYLPSAISVFLSTVFGSDDILQYNQLQSSNPIVNTLFGAAGVFGEDMILFIQIIGLVAFVRGWMMVAKGASQSGHQQGGLGKGMMHIFGGIMAINIVQTLNVINETLFG
jgi:intracellular multiplication protein IcmC